MKLIQRIVLKYYILKFKLIEFVSPSTAAKAAFELFCTPYTKRRNYPEPTVFSKAEKLSFKCEDNKINGFRWQPQTSSHRKVLICHGFDSNSYKFEQYIDPLLQNGFEVFAFDAPAHGISSGKTITALLYRNMIMKAHDDYGPFYAIIAHSFGGIATALTIEELQDDHQLKKIVLIAPATETTRSLNDFCKYLQISSRLKQEMEKLITSIAGKPAEWYSVARIVQSITIPTLWIHDRYDKITPYEDMEFLTQKNLPAVTFMITEGLGHSLYNDDNVAGEILTFISETSSK